MGIHLTGGSAEFIGRHMWKRGRWGETGGVEMALISASTIEAGLVWSTQADGVADGEIETGIRAVRTACRIIGVQAEVDAVAIVSVIAERGAPSPISPALQAQAAGTVVPAATGIAVGCVTAGDALGAIVEAVLTPIAFFGAVDPAVPTERGTTRS